MRSKVLLACLTAVILFLERQSNRNQFPVDPIDGKAAGTAVRNGAHRKAVSRAGQSGPGNILKGANPNSCRRPCLRVPTRSSSERDLCCTACVGSWHFATIRRSAGAQLAKGCA
jgi:hypothetical protein